MNGTAFCGALALAVLTGAAPAGALILPRDGHPVAVLHRPGDARAVAEAVAGAGGFLLDGRGERVTYAVSANPGFSTRLQGAGPWIVLDAAAAGGCRGLPSSLSGTPRPPAPPAVPGPAVPRITRTIAS